MDEDEKQLRQVVRMAHQLPQPDWDLFARTTKKWSKAGKELKGIDFQAMVGKKKRKNIKKKKDDKVDQGGQK